MTQLTVLMEDRLFFVRTDDHVGETLYLQGRSYRERRIPDDDLVFYDWVIDEADVVRALEIHLAPDDPLLASAIPLQRIPGVETCGFVRIWLGSERIGTARGLEAFGDISFFGSESAHLAIRVGLGSWLSSSQADSILQRAALDTPGDIAHSGSE